MQMRFKLRDLALMLAILIPGIAGCAGTPASPDDEAGDAFDDVRMGIQSTVLDPDRVSKAVALISELQQEFASVGQTIKTRRVKVLELYADYDSTRADLDAAMNDILSISRSNREKVGDIQRQLVGLLSAEEWSAVQKKHSKALSVATEALKQAF